MRYIVQSLTRGRVYPRPKHRMPSPIRPAPASVHAIHAVMAVSQRIPRLTLENPPRNHVLHPSDAAAESAAVRW